MYKIVEGEAVEIEYTVAETTGYPGYTASTTEPVESGETITNTQEEATADALKAWVNADGSTEAPEGATVVFTLYADEEETEYTVTLDGTAETTAPEVTGGYESEAWKASFVHLPKYQADGETEIEYSVAETTGYAGYTASTTDPVASGETITNSQDETDANALKAWKNADGSTTPPTGATVVFTLYADDEETEYTVTLDGTAETTAPEVTGGYESEAWKATFVHLPKSKVVDGEEVEIEYTVAETTGYAGYTASTTDPVASGETITNKQDETDAYALKAWEYAGQPIAAPRGATVVFTLYADNEATDYTVTLDGTAETTAPEVTGGYESEPWKASFVHLPMYQADGTTPVVYTIAETEGCVGYTASTEDPVASGETITNIQDVTQVDVEKVWNDLQEHVDAGLRPDSVVVYLEQNVAGETNPDGTAKWTKRGESVTLSATTGWKHSWPNLEKYKLDEVGKEMNYRVTEEKVKGYSPSYETKFNEETNSYEVKVTNKINEVPNATPPVLRIFKTDQDGIALQGATFNLFNAAGAKVREADYVSDAQGNIDIEIPIGEGWLGVDERIQDTYTFTLKELTSPTGYDDPDEDATWTVTVKPKTKDGDTVYDVEYRYNGEEKNEYERWIQWIVQKLSGADKNYDLTVENPASAQTVVITKTFAGLKALPDDFKITVDYTAYEQEKGGTTPPLELKAGMESTDHVTVAKEGNTITWTIDNVRFGTSVVATESAYEEPGYAVESTFSTKIKGGEATEPAEGIKATIANVPAGDTEGEIVGNIDFFNTYTCVNLVINKTIDKLVSYDDDEEVKDATFTFRIVGKNTAGETVLNTVAAVMFNAETETSNFVTINKIPADIKEVTVTEIDSGNYVWTKVNEETVSYADYVYTWTVSFNNTQNGGDYESGAINKYEKTADGYVKAGSGTSGGQEGGAGDSQEN